jgi:hypothetical protein
MLVLVSFVLGLVSLFLLTITLVALSGPLFFLFVRVYGLTYSSSAVCFLCQHERAQRLARASEHIIRSLQSILSRQCVVSGMENG